APAGSPPTRATTATPTGPTCGGVASRRGSPGGRSSRRPGWGGTAGGSRGPCRGWAVLGGCRGGGTGGRGGGWASGSWLWWFRRVQVGGDRDSGRWFAFVLVAWAVVCFNRL